MSTNQSNAREGYQQGDVILVAVDGLPEGATPVAPRNGYLVLAEGESTGHYHGIAVADYPETSLYEKGGVLYLVVGDPTAAIVHQEHNPQVADSGTYMIEGIQEVDPFTEEIRNVRD